MKYLTVFLVVTLALFPWWAIPAVEYLSGIDRLSAIVAVCGAIAAIWTPSVSLVTLIVYNKIKTQPTKE